MILTFNLGVYDNYTIIKDRKKISIIYLKSNFILDLIPIMANFYLIFEEANIFI